MKTQNRSLTITVCALATCLALSTAGRAAVIVNWQNDPVTATDLSIAAASVATGVSSSVLSQNIGASAGYVNALGGLQNASGVNSLAAAITANDYFSFTVTPDVGQEVSFSSLFLRYSVGANVRPATTVFSLLSSATGFTASDGLGTVTADLPSASSATGTGTFTLGQALLQNVTTAVTFRLYVYNTGINPMTRIAIGQLSAINGTPDLTLDGTIAAIPEPSTWALLTLGLACVTVFHCRRAA